MPTSRFGSVFVIAASAAVLMAAGCASAATNTTAGGSTSRARTTSVARTTAAKGAVHFIGYSKNSDGPDFTVILSGVIGDYGPAVTVRPDGTIDPEHSSELRLGLKHGSFRLNIASLDKKLVSATSRWSSTPTCSFHVSVTAATPVVAGSGTGLYRRISGSVTITVTIDEVDVKPCPGGTSRFVSQLIFMAGSGTVSLG
jgi:hypothetical protein